MTRRGPAVLSEVARHAEVSLATASRVLNGSERTVGEPHRSRVLAAAEELGYQPNAHAQAIARGTSNLVGLIVHDIVDPYFSAISDGVVRAAEDRGMVVMLASTRRDPERELNYVSMLRSHRARAVIIAGSRTSSRAETSRLRKEVEAFAESGGRVAIISQNRLGTHTVQPENRAGARDLAAELCRLGHRRFSLLAGPKDLLTARERLTGFLDGLTRAGVPKTDVRVQHGAFTRDGGYQAAAQLTAEHALGTCVFAVNDVMAVGAMAAFRDAGLSVPGEVSVAGFDDIATLRDLAPSLTTVHLPLEDMGARAARLALEDGAGEPPSVISVPGRVVLRDSTRAVR